jgi:hypothetical protein
MDVDIDAMEAGPELDVLVAELMGWTEVMPGLFGVPVGVPPGGTTMGTKQPITPYSTDIAADYSVLCHVRETWGASNHESFFTLLWWAWAHRQDKDIKAATRDIAEGWGAMPTYYQPGDYSRAALKAVTAPKHRL